MNYEGRRCASFILHPSSFILCFPRLRGSTFCLKSSDIIYHRGAEDAETDNFRFCFLCALSVSAVQSYVWTLRAVFTAEARFCDFYAGA